MALLLPITARARWKPDLLVGCRARQQKLLLLWHLGIQSGVLSTSSVDTLIRSYTAEMQAAGPPKWVPTVLMVGSSCSSLVHKQGVSGSSEMVWHWCSCCLLYQLSGPYVSSSVLPAWRKGEDGGNWASYMVWDHLT